MLGADEGKQRRRADDEHDAAGGFAGIDKNLDQLLPLDFPVDEQADQKRIHNGYGRRFRRGEDAAVDAAEDDDRDHEPPERRAEGFQPLAPGGAFTGGDDSLFVNLDHHNHNQRKAHHDARHDTGHEHLADRHAGDGGVNDEGDGRRNDDGDGGSRRHQGGRKRRGEAALVDHGGDQDDAQSRHSCGAGAGDGAEEHGDNNAYDGDAAADVADAVVNKVNQALGNAGLGHDVSGEHEERNGQKQELCHAGKQVGRNHRHLVPRIDHGQNGGYAEAHRNGGIQQQEDEKRPEENKVNHACSASSPPAFFAGSSFSA